MGLYQFLRLHRTPPYKLTSLRNVAKHIKMNLIRRKQENIAYAKAIADIGGRLIGPHQHAGVKWMLAQEFKTPAGGLLADAMGMGKTNVTIAVLRGNPKATLIVVPVSILHQWRDALTTFGRTSPFIMDNYCTMESLPAGVDLVLTAYSMFQKQKKPIPGILAETDWGRIILDEAHMMKNPKSILYRQIIKLKATIRWALTATPIQNSIQDIKTLQTWIGHVGNVEDFIETAMLRRTMEEESAINPRFQLPQLQSITLKIPFKYEEERRLYQDIEKKFQTTIEQTEDGCKLYTDAIQGILRCRQACCHPSLCKATGESTKFDFLCNDIKENPKEKCLIFCSWSQEMSMLSKQLMKEGVSVLRFDGNMNREQKENVLRNFKSTSIQVLLIQIQCGSVGLNLQEATRVYICSCSWNPTVELQAIARSHRIGQQQIVKCYRLVIENTIEERILDIQSSKLDIISDALDDESLSGKLGAVNALSKADIGKLFKKRIASDSFSQE